MNRDQRASLAQQTIGILDSGYYVAPSGRRVEIEADLRLAVSNSRLYRPADFPALTSGCELSPPFVEQKIEVTSETTLEAASRLVSSGDGEPCCLNFASAKNPGGGFLSGSQAQEESLARSSGLHACLIRHMELYEYNRGLHSSMYSDHMIYSPGVPVFRDDGGQLLERPYKVSFISAPAVNAGAVRKTDPTAVPLIGSTMEARLEKVLWVAAGNGHRTLILGAWGCGVFGNDPSEVGELFARALGPGGRFQGHFERVVYAVYDRTPAQEVLSSFRKGLAGAGV
ncbi:MAG: TIGR02452 family protein [Verrucomicrobia bacterium]|nr:TIGR02452 family protein [Verrucomicrobiota bacterium]